MVNPFRLVRPTAVTVLSHGHGHGHAVHQKPVRTLPASGRAQETTHGLRPRVPPTRHPRVVPHDEHFHEAGWNPARDAEVLSPDAGLPVEAMGRGDGQGGQGGQQSQDEDSDPGSAHGGGHKGGRRGSGAPWWARNPSAQRVWQDASDWLALHPTTHDLTADMLARLHDGRSIRQDLRLLALAGLQEQAPRMADDLVHLADVAMRLRQTAEAGGRRLDHPSPVQVSALLLLPLLLLNWSRPRRSGDRQVAAQRLLLAAPEA